MCQVESAAERARTSNFSCLFNRFTRHKMVEFRKETCGRKCAVMSLACLIWYQLMASSDEHPRNCQRSAFKITPRADEVDVSFQTELYILHKLQDTPRLPPPRINLAPHIWTNTQLCVRLSLDLRLLTGRLVVWSPDLSIDI